MRATRGRSVMCKKPGVRSAFPRPSWRSPMIGCRSVRFSASSRSSGKRVRPEAFASRRSSACRRAGLEIAAAARSLETRGTEPLAVRIGIATGLVRPGEAQGRNHVAAAPICGHHRGPRR